MTTARKPSATATPTKAVRPSRRPAASAPSRARVGLSLHIGLNKVNPAHYGGWDGSLNACEADANDMEAIARAKGFATTKRLTAAAKSATIIRDIRNAAAKLKAGDIFLLTYSGHGGQLPDTNGDEPDRQDETWVLYDRQLVDDEIYALFGAFAKGVRIFVLSDSCHSGTVARVMPAGLDAGQVPRLMPPSVAAKTYESHRSLYDKIQASQPTRADSTKGTLASVILISGCQDNQLSLDGARNGLFTANLRAVWDGGRFTGSYRRFRDRIASRMPASQTPNYFVAGLPSASFAAQTPFSV
jgi:hypothetical protein